MNIGEEQEPIELPIPVDPASIPQERPATQPAQPVPQEQPA